MRVCLQHMWMNRDPLLKGENYWGKYRRVSRMCSEGNETDSLVQRNLIHSFNDVFVSIGLLRRVVPPSRNVTSATKRSHIHGILNMLLLIFKK